MKTRSSGAQSAAGPSGLFSAENAVDPRGRLHGEAACGPTPVKLSPLAGLALLALLACRHPHASGPLRQEAYVWQRSWTPAVREAVRQANGISGFVVLAAEVDLRQGAPGSPGSRWTRR